MSTNVIKRTPAAGGRLTIWYALASFLLVMQVIAGSPMASAQEAPIFVARHVLDIGGWCGDRAVYFNGSTQILDVFSKKQVRLQFNRSEYSIERCSPNGRWAIAKRLGTRAESQGIVLWDLQQGSLQEVGRGYVDFSWSPDGKIVLYRFIPTQGYEKDPTNSIRFPAAVPDFQAVSTLDLISNSIVPSSGWPNQGRGSTVLVIKAGENGELFRIDHDQK
jgi:hypothetical protein